MAINSPHMDGFHKPSCKYSIFISLVAMHMLESSFLIVTFNSPSSFEHETNHVTIIIGFIAIHHRTSITYEQVLHKIPVKPTSWTKFEGTANQNLSKSLANPHSINQSFFISNRLIAPTPTQLKAIKLPLSHSITPSIENR